MLTPLLTQWQKLPGWGDSGGKLRGKSGWMLRPVRSWDTADGAKCGDQDLDPTGAARPSPGGQFRKRQEIADLWSLRRGCLRHHQAR